MKSGRPARPVSDFFFTKYRWLPLVIILQHIADEVCQLVHVQPNFWQEDHHIILSKKAKQRLVRLMMGGNSVSAGDDEASWVPPGARLPWWRGRGFQQTTSLLLTPWNTRLQVNLFSESKEQALACVGPVHRPDGLHESRDSLHQTSRHSPTQWTETLCTFKHFKLGVGRKQACMPRCTMAQAMEIEGSKIQKSKT